LTALIMKVETTRELLQCRRIGGRNHMVRAEAARFLELCALDVNAVTSQPKAEANSSAR
jgi:hypothetical protein